MSIGLVFKKFSGGVQHHIEVPSMDTVDVADKSSLGRHFHILEGDGASLFRRRVNTKNHCNRKTNQKWCTYIHIRLYHALQSCGATHSHFPFLILAVNGLAGKPVLPMIGQLAMHGLLVKEVGSVRSQQSTTPHA